MFYCSHRNPLRTLLTDIPGPTSSQKAHPNVFLSLSTAINGRSPAHRALAAACAPNRLLIESDLYDARLAPRYAWHMLRTVAAVKGWRVESAWDYADDDEGDGDDGERDWDDARESKSRNMRSRGWGDARG